MAEQQINLVEEQEPAPVVATPLKNPRGKTIRSGQKLMIYNLYVTMREQDEESSKTNIVKVHSFFLRKELPTLNKVYNVSKFIVLGHWLLLILVYFVGSYRE